MKTMRKKAVKKNIDFKYEIVKLHISYEYVNEYNILNRLTDNFHPFTSNIILPLHQDQFAPLDDKFYKVVRTFKDNEAGAIYIFTNDKNDNDIKKYVESNGFIKHNIIFINYNNVIKNSPFKFLNLKVDKNSILILTNFNEYGYLEDIELCNSVLIVNSNKLSSSTLKQLKLDNFIVFLESKTNDNLLCYKCHFKNSSSKHVAYLDGNLYKNLNISFSVSSDYLLHTNINNSVDFSMKTDIVIDNEKSYNDLSNILKYLSNLNTDNVIVNPMFGFNNIDILVNSNLILDNISLGGELIHIVWIKTIYGKNNKCVTFLEPFIYLNSKYVSLNKFKSILLLENTFGNKVTYDLLFCYINSIKNEVSRTNKNIIIVA